MFYYLFSVYIIQHLLTKVNKRKVKKLKIYLKEAREKRGISQAELAEHLGVSQAFISRIESNSKSIPYTLYVQVADFLKCSLDEIAGREYK